MIEGMCWNERIAQAKINGFTEDDKDKAGRWQNCSLGEKLGLYKLGNEHQQWEIGDYTNPTSFARKLGNLFSDAVTDGQPELAEKIHKRIQQCGERELKSDMYEAANSDLFHEAEQYENEYYQNKGNDYEEDEEA